METQRTGNVFDGQSELYIAVATAYRAALTHGANEENCQFAAMRAVRSAHPFFSEKEAQRLAARIVAQFSERYPEWLSVHPGVEGAR